MEMEPVLYATLSFVPECLYWVTVLRLHLMHRLESLKCCTFVSVQTQHRCLKFLTLFFDTFSVSGSLGLTLYSHNETPTSYMLFIKSTNIPILKKNRFQQLKR